MIAALLLAQAVTVTPQSAPHLVPMVPIIASGTMQCEFRDEYGAVFTVSGTLTPTPAAQSDQPAQLSMSLRGVDDPRLDGEYGGWYIRSNLTFSFNQVNQTDSTLMALTLHGARDTSKQTVAVMQISPIGRRPVGRVTDDKLFVGFCTSSWVNGR